MDDVGCRIVEAFEVVDEPPPAGDHFEAEIGIGFGDQSCPGFSQACRATPPQGFGWGAGHWQGSHLVLC